MAQCIKQCTSRRTCVQCPGTHVNPRRSGETGRFLGLAGQVNSTSCETCLKMRRVRRKEPKMTQGLQTCVCARTHTDTNPRKRRKKTKEFYTFYPFKHSLRLATFNILILQVRCRRRPLVHSWLSRTQNNHLGTILVAILLGQQLALISQLHPSPLICVSPRFCGLR